MATQLLIWGPMIKHWIGRWMYVAVLLVACDSPISVTCTDIGCSGGPVVVVMDSPPDVPITLVVQRGTVTSLPITCQAHNGQCDVELNAWYPTRITIDVSWGDSARSFTVDPIYEIVQPNGPNCSPTCEIARVEISLAAEAASASEQASRLQSGILTLWSPWSRGIGVLVRTSHSFI